MSTEEKAVNVVDTATTEVEKEGVVEEKKVHTPGRFDFVISVNGEPYYKRNFKINFYNKDSLQSVQMKEQFYDIYRMVDEDLKSKSRLWTWYHFDEEYQEGELHEPLLEEGDYDIKLSILYDGREVMSRVWDGRYYPKAIREKIDLSNRFVDISGKKIPLTEINDNRLSVEGYINKVIVSGRQDINMAIIKMVCEICSPEEIEFDEDGTAYRYGEFSSMDDYDFTDTYETAEPIIENGEIVGRRVLDSKKYVFSNQMRHNDFVADMMKTKGIEEKNRKYFEEECYGIFNPIPLDTWTF